MIVLIGGSVDIVEHFGRPDKRALTTYALHEFLGEMGLLTANTISTEQPTIYPIKS